MASSGPLLCPVLVGRDPLLELAERRLTATLDGRGHLFFLAGEAGIGKTRLLGAIERRASTHRYRVVRCAAFPRDLEVAAAPLLDLARAMARSDGLAAFGEDLARRLADDGPIEGDAHRRRRLLVLDTADLLIAAAERPTLIALEDLHWSDDLTLEIIAAAARRLPEAPLFIVATYRSDELYPRVPMRDWRARLLAARAAEEVRLDRLSPAETAVIARLLVAGDGLISSDAIAAIHARTDGIPLHVEELLALLVARGLDGPEPVMAADVPDTLDVAVLDRLERRSRAARTVARAGAVIGRSFDLELLAGVVGFHDAQLDRALAELSDHFFLREAEAPARYDFRHALIRDAIYSRIPLSLRRRLHARVADLAGAQPDSSDAFLSAHYEQAGRRKDAFATSLRAARSARAVSSHHEAYALYRRAFRNLPATLIAGSHAELLEELGVAAAAADENEAAATAFESARERYRSAGRDVDAARVVAPLVAARHLVGDGFQARSARLSEGLAELVHRRGPATEIARAALLAGLSAAAMLDRRLDDSIEHGRRALDLARSLGDEPTELHVLATVGSDLVFAGRMDEGWAMLEDAIRRGRDACLEAETARAYRMISSSASVLVEYERAERLLREGIEYAERVELWNHRHYMAAHLAHVLWATGRWAQAETIAQYALADGRGGITTRITALHVLGYVALGRGAHAAARAALDEARDLGESMAELQRLSPALWGLAELSLALGDASGAIGWCERGRRASVAVRDAAYLFPFLVTGTRAHLANGDPDAAARWTDEVAAVLADRAIPGTMPAINHARGLVELAHGATGRARDRLTAAADGWRERGRAWEGMDALLALGECHLRTNRLSDARAAAEEAAEWAEGAGRPDALRRANDLVRAVRSRRPIDDAWKPLTGREYAVARLVADGQTNAAIAAELGIAPRTAATHVEHILAKLGAQRRSEIAAWVAAHAERMSGSVRS